MRHLSLANGSVGGGSTSHRFPIAQLCYIFIDWGGCQSPDECGFDIGSCPGSDICLVDY